MKVWNGRRLTAVAREPVLVIGADESIQRALTREIEALPAPVLRAESMSAAAAGADAFGHPPGVALVPESAISPEDFGAELAKLRIRANAPHLVPIAFGRAPDDARRRALREAGVELALFGRFGRHALRFQINRALSPWAEGPSRGELRAPKEWRARTYAAGEEKSVRCYCLSSGGAFFVTPRPWVVGSDIALELPVGRDRLLVPGRIVYTNAGERLDRGGLPHGMAVAFRSLSGHVREVIRQDVTATHAALDV